MKTTAITLIALVVAMGCAKHEGEHAAEHAQQATTAQQSDTAQTAPAAQPAATATEASAPAAAGEVQTVDIKVSGGDYIPASVKVAAGKPVRLNFTRDEKPTCGDVLVFPTLNIKKKIEIGQVTTVDLPAQQAGELKFTCGMDMLKGTVVVQ